MTTADGAPRPLAIYYPSPRFIPPRPMLRSCLGRWPLVLFLHGDPPNGLTPAQLSSYHRAWWRVPVALARSGYVVVVPQYSSVVADAGNSPALVAEAMRDIDWVRSQWHEAKWVGQASSTVSVAGHSFGALLAARVAAARPEIGALISLGGGFFHLNDARALLSAIRCPSLFMFSTDNSRNGELFLAFELIDGNPAPANNLWPSVAGPTYAATYDGGHFDYLDPALSGSAFRGRCGLIADVAAELAALFIASNVQSLTPVPVDLRKPAPPLSAAQEALAIQYLTGVARMAQDRDCRVRLKWRVGQEAGERMLGA